MNAANALMRQPFVVLLPFPLVAMTDEFRPTQVIAGSKPAARLLVSGVGSDVSEVINVQSSITASSTT